MPKHESENFYRIITLLVNVCTPILRRVFMNYARQYAQSVTSGATPSSSGSSAVYLFLVNHQGALMQLYRKKVIRQEQLTLLTPASGTSVNLELWDISLLTTVLKTICPLSNIEMIEVENLRKARNAMFAHKATATLQLPDFLTQWQVIETCALTLLPTTGDTTFEKENIKLIQTTKTGPLEVGGTTEALATWYSHDLTVGARLETLGDKMEQLVDQVSKMAAHSQPPPSDPVFAAMKRNTETLLDGVKQSTFVTTSQYEEARQKLTSENVILLLGDTGDGKTTLGLKLMLQCQEADKCIVLQNLVQWEHIDTEKVNLVLIDDMLGKTSLEESKIPVQILDIIQSSVTSKSVQVVMTSRRLVFQVLKSDLARYDIFKHVIDMSSERLSLEEKSNILEAHLLTQKRSLPERDVIECCNSYQLAFGFMKQCHRFTKEVSMFQKGVSSFSLPTEYVHSVLRSLTKTQYLALVLLFYSKNSIKETELKPTRRKEASTAPGRLFTKLTELSECIGMHSAVVTIPVIRDCLDLLCENFLTNEDRVFAFKVNALYVCVGLMHGKEYPEDILEVCDLEFLCNHVSETFHPDKLLIDSDCYDVLAERFIAEVTESSSKMEIANHEMLSNKGFAEVLIETLSNKVLLSAFVWVNDRSKARDESFVISFLKSRSDDKCVPFMQAMLPRLQHDHTSREGCSTHESVDECNAWQCLVVKECTLLCCAKEMRVCIDLITSSAVCKSSFLLSQIVHRGSVEIMENCLNTLHKKGILTKCVCEEIARVAKAIGKPEVESILRQMIQQFA